MNFLKNRKFQIGAGVVVALGIGATVFWVIYSNIQPGPSAVLLTENSPANNTKPVSSHAQEVLAGGIESVALEGLSVEELKAAYDQYTSGQITLEAKPADVEKHFKEAIEKLEKNNVAGKDGPEVNTLQPKPSNQINSQGEQEEIDNNAVTKNGQNAVTVKEGEEPLVPLTDEEYYKQKGTILQAIRAAITAYDEAAFATQLATLNELRTRFKKADNDQNANQRIAAATAESAKTMLATLLKTDIVKQHDALFKNPPKPFPEPKLKAIVAIREALGLTTYDPKHFKTLEDYDAHVLAEAARVCTEEYYKAKDVLLKSLKADVEAYNGAKFSTDFAELIALRTKFTEVDNDPNAATRIPAATADATRKFLGTLMKAEIIQKHEALFKIPLDTGAETKLNSILKIREELELTTYGAKEHNSLDDYRIFMRGEEFKKFIAALKAPGANKDATKKALLDAFKNIGPITPAGILSLPLHLAILECDESEIDDQLLLQALSVYFVPIHAIDENVFILDRKSPNFHLQEFIVVGKTIQANLSTEGEDKIRENILRRIIEIPHHRIFNSFRERLSGLAISRHISERSEAEKCIYESLIWRRSPLTLFEDDKEKPTYDAFKKVVDALFPNEKPIIMGIKNDVVTDEEGYKKELAKEVATDEIDRLPPISGPKLNEEMEKAVTDIIAKITAVGLTPDADFIRNYLRETLIRRDAALVNVFLPTPELIESEIARLKGCVETSLQKLDTGFGVYLDLLKIVYGKSGKPASEFKAFHDEIRASVRKMANKAIKGVSKENYEIFHFLCSTQHKMEVEFSVQASGTHNQDLSIVERDLSRGVSATPGNVNLKKIVSALFYQALESMRSKGNKDIEKEPLLKDLQTALRYYCYKNWTLWGISRELEDYIKTLPPADPLGVVGLELVAKYHYLWSINFYTSNAERLTDAQISAILPKITKMFTDLKGNYCFPRVLAAMSPKSIVPFWLVTNTTTPEEFRNFCSVAADKKQAVITQVEAAKTAFLATPKDQALQDAIGAQIATIKKDL